MDWLPKTAMKKEPDIASIRARLVELVRKILALADIYGHSDTERAIDDALAFNAFSSEYIAHLLQSRARSKPLASSPLSLMRSADLLELDLPEPDLSIYEVKES